MAVLGDVFKMVFCYCQSIYALSLLPLPHGWYGFCFNPQRHNSVLANSDIYFPVSQSYSWETRGKKRQEKKPISRMHNFVNVNFPLFSFFLNIVWPSPCFYFVSDVCPLLFNLAPKGSQVRHKTASQQLWTKTWKEHLLQLLLRSW